MLSYPGMNVFLDAEISLEAKEWRNDKRIWKWCRQYTLLSLDDHTRWLSSLSSSPHKMYGICDLISKRPVGTCGLTNIDKHNQRAEFSLLIDPEMHQRGYGKCALLTLLRHGFDDHNFQCIWGETYDGNPAAKLFESVGMTREGTLRQRYYRDGKWKDAHVYSILRHEFSRLAPHFFGDVLSVGNTPFDNVLVDEVIEPRPAAGVVPDKEIERLSKDVEPELKAHAKSYCSFGGAGG